jgi:rod shape determining protein RodA
VQAGVLEDYQVRRLTAFTDPAADPDGAGYNTQQARIAIGSGGLWGTGLLEGPQTQGRFVPEQQTDFVFTVAGEELGLVGSGALILLLGIVLFRAYRIALRADDLFGRLVATGVLCWFTFQAFKKIGMCLGPPIIRSPPPMPFLSVRGLSMFANLVAVGCAQEITSTAPVRRYPTTPDSPSTIHKTLSDAITPGCSERKPLDRAEGGFGRAGRGC